MLGYLPLDIICSSNPNIFLELRSRKTVRFSKQMSKDEYHSMFSRQMKTVVCLRSHQTPESLTNIQVVTTCAKTCDNRTIAGVQTQCLKSDVENNMDTIRRYSN